MRLQGEQALCTLRRDLLVLGVDGELLRRRTGVDHGIDLRGDRAVDDHELMVHQHVPQLLAQLGREVAAAVQERGEETGELGGIGELVIGIGGERLRGDGADLLERRRPLGGALRGPQRGLHPDPRRRLDARRGEQRHHALDAGAGGAVVGEHRDLLALEGALDELRAEVRDEGGELVVLGGEGLGVGAQLLLLGAQLLDLAGQLVAEVLAQRPGAEDDAHGEREEHGDQRDEVVSEIDHGAVTLLRPGDPG